MHSKILIFVEESVLIFVEESVLIFVEESVYRKEIVVSHFFRHPSSGGLFIILCCRARLHLWGCKVETMCLCQPPLFLTVFHLHTYSRVRTHTHTHTRHPVLTILFYRQCFYPTSETTGPRDLHATSVSLYLNF